jgi:fructokinase
MVSAVGSDDLGDQALEKLRNRGVRCDHVARDPLHDTGRVLVSLNVAGQASYEFASDVAWDHISWSEPLGALAANCNAVCFGTLGQRSQVSRETIRRFVAATPHQALRVFDVNLRQRFYDRETIEASLELASVLKLNDEELPVMAEMLGIRVGDERKVLRELADQFGLRVLALTRGPGGSLLMANGDEDECMAPPTTVVDTVGAGDSFTAALVLGLLRGLPLDLINTRANAVAAFVCSQNGATPELPQHLAGVEPSAR